MPYISSLRRKLTDDEITAPKINVSQHDSILNQVEVGASGSITLDSVFQEAVKQTLEDPEVQKASRIIASFQKGKMLTVEQKIYIVQQKVEFDRRTQSIVCETGVSQALIDGLVREYQANPNWLSEMKQQMDDDQEDDQHLNKIIAAEVMEKRPFFSIASIKDRAAISGMEDVNGKVIATKLKKEFGLSYRKVSVISHLSNVDKNLILRQLWAIKYLELLEDTVEVWNAD